MDDFVSESDSDYASYWRDWVSGFLFFFSLSLSSSPYPLPLSNPAFPTQVSCWHLAHRGSCNIKACPEPYCSTSFFLFGSWANLTTIGSPIPLSSSPPPLLC